jgi:two-component system sensor histidine kinase BaeS
VPPGRPARPRPPWWPADEAWPPEPVADGPPRGGPGHRFGRHGRADGRHPGPESWPWLPASGGPGGRRGRGGRGGPGGRAWRGFGCLFGIVFLVVLGSLVAVASAVLSSLGPAPAIVVGVAALALLVGLGRWLRRSAGTLDDVVDAARRIEAGDLTARATTPASGRGPVGELVRGFNAMAVRLEADEARRRTLLADIGHELRTPLAVIQGEVEAIADGVHPADPDHLGTILDEVGVMARLADDLRTVTLSEAGTLPLHPEPTDLALLAADVATAQARVAEAVGVRLTVDAGAGPATLEADPVRLREVVSNLTANAIRHAPGGTEVRLRIRRAPERPVVRLEVIDAGPGIDPAILADVFERFVKGPASRGSGLGLAIARSLVEAHGGTISATSEPGRGTTMTVELPAAEA